MGSKLVHQRTTCKRSRAIVIMLLPVLIFLSIVGWCMYTLGDRKPKR